MGGPLQWLPPVCGALGPALIPPAHIAVLWYFWQNYARYVDRRFCSCSCWDTVFKGTYESGIASYKHMYFNATENSLKMWILVVLGILSMYECSKHLSNLLLQGKLRHTMAMLFCSSIFSHYYSWWAYLNYYNDDFYSQWNHQMLFTISEILSTCMVLHLASSDNLVTSKKSLTVIGIALLHILAGGADQFVLNVVKGEGYSHQVVRDLGFMIPDILHVALPVVELRRARRDSYTARPCCRDVALRRDVALMLAIVLVAFSVCNFL